jgi:hypothetical protein
VLTPRLRAYVRRTFPTADVDAALVALEDRRVPSLDDPPPERFLAAVVFLAEGRAEELVTGFELGETDYRDLLVAAGLGETWWPDVLDDRLGRS